MEEVNWETVAADRAPQRKDIIAIGNKLLTCNKYLKKTNLEQERLLFERVLERNKLQLRKSLAFQKLNRTKQLLRKLKMCNIEQLSRQYRDEMVLPLKTNAMRIPQVPAPSTITTLCKKAVLSWKICQILIEWCEHVTTWNELMLKKALFMSFFMWSTAFSSRLRILCQFYQQCVQNFYQAVFQTSNWSCSEEDKINIPKLDTSVIRHSTRPLTRDIDVNDEDDNDSRMETFNTSLDMPIQQAVHSSDSEQEHTSPPESVPTSSTVDIPDLFSQKRKKHKKGTTKSVFKTIKIKDSTQTSDSMKKTQVESDDIDDIFGDLED